MISIIKVYPIRQPNVIRKGFQGVASCPVWFLPRPSRTGS